MKLNKGVNKVYNIKGKSFCCGDIVKISYTDKFYNESEINERILRYVTGKIVDMEGYSLVIDSSSEFKSSIKKIICIYDVDLLEVLDG